jgi:hypothetical protein
MLSTLEQLLVTSLNTALGEPEVEAVPRSHLRFITKAGISLRVIELINDLPDPHEAKDMLLRQPVGRVKLEAEHDTEAVGEKTAEGGEEHPNAVAGYEETVPTRISLEVFSWERAVLRRMLYCARPWPWCWPSLPARKSLIWIRQQKLRRNPHRLFIFVSIILWYRFGICNRACRQ